MHHPSYFRTLALDSWYAMYRTLVIFCSKRSAPTSWMRVSTFPVLPPAIQSNMPRQGMFRAMSRCSPNDSVASLIGASFLNTSSMLMVLLVLLPVCFTVQEQLLSSARKNILLRHRGRSEVSCSCSSIACAFNNTRGKTFLKWAKI